MCLYEKIFFSRNEFAPRNFPTLGLFRSEFPIGRTYTGRGGNFEEGSYPAENVHRAASRTC